MKISVMCNHYLIRLIDVSRDSGKNWSFQGVSDANLCAFEPRVFHVIFKMVRQGFPFLACDSYLHPPFLTNSPPLYIFVESYIAFASLSSVHEFLQDKTKDTP